MIDWAVFHLIPYIVYYVVSVYFIAIFWNLLVCLLQFRLVMANVLLKKFIVCKEYVRWKYYLRDMFKCA